MKILSLAVVVLGMSSMAMAADAEHHESLFARLGGEKGVHAMVDEWVNRVVTDAHVQKYYEHLAKDKAAEVAFEKNLADYICKATGGTCAYHGPATVLAEAHIPQDVFDVVEKHLHETMDHLKIHEAEQHELKAVVDKLEPAAVGH
jgi:hemoglobin